MAAFQQHYTATGAALTPAALGLFRARTAVGELQKIVDIINADLTQTALIEQTVRKQFALVRRVLQLGEES